MTTRCTLWKFQAQRRALRRRLPHRPTDSLALCFQAVILAAVQLGVAVQLAVAETYGQS